MAKKKENNMLPEMVSWFRETYPELAPLMVFVPKANVTLQKKGATYGSADIIILYPTERYASLCIQLFEWPRTTEPQNRWRIIVESAGNKCAVVKDLVGFVKAVDSYLKDTPYA